MRNVSLFGQGYLKSQLSSPSIKRCSTKVYIALMAEGGYCPLNSLSVLVPEMNMVYMLLVNPYKSFAG